MQRTRCYCALSAFGLAWLILHTGCSEKSPDRGTALPPPASRPAVSVSIETVEPRPLAHRIPIVGTLYAAEQVSISSKAAGVLRHTFVDVGATVRPGDPLLQVDRTDYEMAVHQAEALLNEALARLGVESAPADAVDLNQVSTVQRAAAQLANARFTYERLTNLQSAVAAQELDDASARLRVAEADFRLALDEAGALAASARGRLSALELARQQLDETLTRTPPIPTTLGKEGATEWVVAERHVTEGQYLNVAAPTYVLIVSDPLKLRCRVPERYAADVRIEQVVRIDAHGNGAAPDGRVARISPAVDPASRTFEVEALFDNESGALKPGMFARGRIIVDESAPALSVPTEAVATTGGATQVFVVENGAARRRIVQLGRQAEGRVEVTSGLIAGEQVIARATDTLTDGAPVRTR